MEFCTFGDRNNSGKMSGKKFTKFAQVKSVSLFVCAVYMGPKYLEYVSQPCSIYAMVMRDKDNGLITGRNAKTDCELFFVKMIPKGQKTMVISFCRHRPVLSIFIGNTNTSVFYCPH